MDGVQNMDGKSKPESLGVYINDDFVDNLPTLFPFGSLRDGFEEANLMESFNFQADLPTQNIQETISNLSVVPAPLVSTIYAFYKYYYICIFLEWSFRISQI